MPTNTSLFDAILLAGAPLQNGGSGGNGTSLQLTVNVTNSFSAGNVVYNNNGTWTLAIATAVGTATSLGIIQSATGSSFVVVFAGLINITGFGLAANTTYYLSDATAGLLTTTAPTVVSSYYLPILRTSTTIAGQIIMFYPSALALLTVASGGTGASTLSGLLLGNGTSAITGITTSAAVAAAISDETGSGSLVFATSPALAGNPTAPTQSLGDNSTKIATTAFVLANIGSGGVETLADAATVTPNVAGNIGGYLATLSQSTTLANPTGGPAEFQRFVLRIKSITSQSLSYGGQYRGSSDLPLPAATTGGSKTDYFVFQWNALSSTWDLLGKTFGF